MYNYLISYIFSSRGCLTPGCGTMQLSREKKIKTFEDINEITEFIKKSINLFLILSAALLNIPPIQAVVIIILSLVFIKSLKVILGT